MIKTDPGRALEQWLHADRSLPWWAEQISRKQEGRKSIKSTVQFCSLLMLTQCMHLTPILTYNHIHRILVNPKHSIQLKFRHIPLIEGFALLFMGPSFGIWLLYNYPPSACRGFFFGFYSSTALHCLSGTALERRGLWFKWLLSTPNPPEAHKSDKGSSKRPGRIPLSKEEVLNPKLHLNTTEVTY